MSNETTLKSNKVFDGKVITVFNDEITLENGKSAFREVVRHNGGAAVLAIDSEENIYLVSQHRYPFATEIVEIPAGKLEKGEQPLIAAARELEEEAGITAKNFRLLGEFKPTPGYCDEVIYIYLATQITSTAQKLDEDEFLKLYKMPFHKALQQVISGAITDGKTAYAILMAAQLLR